MAFHDTIFDQVEPTGYDDSGAVLAGNNSGRNRGCRLPGQPDHYSRDESSQNCQGSQTLKNGKRNQISARHGYAGTPSGWQSRPPLLSFILHFRCTWCGALRKTW